MPTEFSSRFAIDPVAAAAMGTEDLRRNFHIGNLFVQDTVKLVYTHYDRMIVGGAMPGSTPLPLETIKPCGTASFLERREMVAVNIGGSGTVTARGESHQLGARDMIYVGRGQEVTFASDDPARPAKFYLLSAPAHHSYPTRRITIDSAKRLDLGSQETSNERSIFQFTTTIETCQLVVGMTQLAKGSVWNTMPAHVHDRRMEAYLYFDLDEAARVFHFMGEPTETRHIIMANEEAVLSPAWSIHSGCGTSNYAFIWAMAGDNVDYTDVDPVALGDMR
ncbi:MULTISPECIES: 5-dehydro-4-deoxy-D-glucuronate isomerase [unclassified Aminobacter]|uniref:5-dehydro-4-deoxy-D-glucuronate isomerase n=1 Tax=unclassified Aminobacter TaxID=2644704 RepID=UPI00046318CC|nr:MULTISPECIES: 5-dehydro-4-deoxy-D-glucuronate isomerase [unclassified Aminobacter]TWH34973.1 4-deoxy-L-threo-5-hexosulose-uronate ketol-isomerase [Aminobacter sp. J15]